MIMVHWLADKTVIATFECALCGDTQKVRAPSQTAAKMSAKAKGWLLLRGDAFCGDSCNETAKANKKRTGASRG